MPGIEIISQFITFVLSLSRTLHGTLCHSAQISPPLKSHTVFGPFLAEFAAFFSITSISIINYLAQLFVYTVYLSLLDYELQGIWTLNVLSLNTHHSVQSLAWMRHSVIIC